MSNIPKHISTPPARREHAATKLIFPVASIAECREAAPALGGELNPGEREFEGRGFRACDGHDPEGNVIQFREHVLGPFHSGEGLQLRPPVASDALCLSVLAMQVFLDTYATDGIRPEIAREALSCFSPQVFADAFADPSAALCLAERAGHLVGFAHVTFGAGHELAPDGQQAELLRLYVQEPFTGKHIGSLLLAEAERIAGERGATVLWLTPWVHNHRALAFYGRRGYKDHGLTHFILEGESHENRVYAKRLGTGAIA